ncbi:helix-turn-helix transcriptional regulator [Pelagicoccus sp. SDUM812002]|uniref:response regulator transcription factor n=1 Tax=Pelagicoccus sp. SDUM812002 TaxID=3041266 RepID=UPI00280D4695|nr:helix-turn-helix transcriptional regulator [Pelagicoccus sp. SDUM812002]MDQ8185802.1 helix-turn-helix transcriptional regulator [Pelagicoccus sp. SDUM812002]
MDPPKQNAKPEILGIPDASESLSIETHRLNSLFAFLGQLGWSIASLDSSESSLYNLHGLAKQDFKQSTVGIPELHSHLKQLPNKVFLHDSKQLIIWREKAVATSDASEPKLTKREIQVFDLLLAGQSVPAIAAELGISQRTAEKHVQNLYRKKGVKSYSELLFKKAWGL